MLKQIVKYYRVGKLKKKLKVRQGCCIYTESCSAYAERILIEKGEIKAAPLILQRLLLCNPIGYKKIGINLYEKSDLGKQKQNQKKANVIMTVFLILILPMQISSFWVLSKLAFQPISSAIETIKD